MPSGWGWGYLGALVALGVLDGLWLGVLARDFYQREYGDLMAPEVGKVPAALFYLMYPVGVVALAVGTPPASLGGVLWRSALLGLMAYGAYDLTNLATIRGWSVKMAIVDLAWGVAVTTAAGAAAWWAMQRAGTH